MNLVRMRATLVERAAVRYTPAGIPVAEAQMVHQSQVQEAGSPRNLDFTFGIIAIGHVATRLAAEGLGSELEFTGFLSPRSHRSARLQVHVQEFTRQDQPNDPGTSRTEQNS